MTLMSPSLEAPKDMEKEADFKIFLKYLIEAGSKMNDPHYFQVHAAGSENPIYRERVYCYELYHQLRCQMTLNGELDYKLDGELDKRSHRIIKGNSKPDFVVHGPSVMTDNLVIIEVKPAKVAIGKVRDDTKKLRLFVSKYNYYNGIMLIYGDGCQKLPDQIVSQVKTMAEHCGKPDSILLMWHRGPSESPKVIFPEKYR